MPKHSWNGSLLKLDEGDDEEDDGGMHQGDEEDTWV